MLATGITPVLIGRTREVEILERALLATLKGTGSCILLVGEAGIGKSRLAAELRDRAASAHFWVWQGYCAEQDDSFPFSVWIDALRSFLASKSAGEANEVLGPFALELVKLLPELSLIQAQIHPIPLLDPAAEKHLLFESLTRFATSLAITHPVLIILEDLHWSDDLSLDLLHFFVRRIASLPILILATYRSEGASARLENHLVELNRERLVKEIQLVPLPRLEVSQMVQSILKSENPVSPAWLDLLMPLTEGIPFFVEEITKSLVQIQAQPGHWDPFQIPRSIQQTVQRQVDQLPELARKILPLASVIGERFDFALLQEVTAEDEETLLPMLKEWIAAHLIVEQTADQYAFRHALTREAIYSSLLLRERKVLHQKVGTALEGWVTHADVPAASLAYHFYYGEQWDKALKYSQRAGEQAQALYAPREALTHFSHALEAAQHLKVAPSLPLLRSRAQAYDLLGEFDRACADNEAALELAIHASNHVGEWQSLLDLGFLWQPRNLERAGEYFQRALDLARELEDESVLAQTLNRVGNWYFNLGQARQALSYHQEALALFREQDDRRGIASTLDLLGIASYQLCEVIQGVNYLEAAVPILRELDDRQGLVNTLTNLTVRALSDTEVLGEIDYQQLLILSDEAFQVASSFHWVQGEMLALMQGAISLEKIGEYQRALERLARARAMAEESRNRESFARLHLIYGHIFVGLMAFSEARQHFETGLAYLQELGSGLLIFAAKVHLASVAILQKDFARAHALLDDLLPNENPQGQGQAHLRRAWSASAELELAQGNPGHALEMIEALLAATPNLAEVGPHAVPYLSRSHAQALAALDRLDEAKAELLATQPVVVKRRQLPMLWRIHADLGNIYRIMGHRADARREFASARAMIQDLSQNVPDGELRDHFLKRALATIPVEPAMTVRQAAKNEFGGLTEREHEVAVLLTQGRSNREIANDLVISEKTAERHIANILSKLGFNSRTQIAAWIVDKGLSK